MTEKEFYIYGSQRLGYLQDKMFLSRKTYGKTFGGAIPALPVNPIISIPNPFILPGTTTITPLYFGNKRYELTDWLGNVRVVINDKKTSVNTGTTTVSYFPQVINVRDYYSFGLEINERTYSYFNTKYRFSFNDKEDIEQRWYQDYGARYYHKALGRFISADPLIVKQKQYAWLSSYQFAANNPIQKIDLDGKEDVDFKFEMYQRQKDAQMLNVSYEDPRQKSLQSFSETTIEMMPIIGDIKDVKDAYDAIKRRDWLDATISFVSLVPFGDIIKPLRKVIKEAAKGLDVSMIRHISGPGTFKKVAIIGRDMDNRVKPYAEKLRKMGAEVETFKPSEEAEMEWAELLKQYKGKQIPDEGCIKLRYLRRM